MYVEFFLRKKIPLLTQRAQICMERVFPEKKYRIIRAHSADRRMRCQNIILLRTYIYVKCKRYSTRACNLILINWSVILLHQFFLHTVISYKYNLISSNSKPNETSGKDLEKQRKAYVLLAMAEKNESIKKEDFT